MTTCGRASGAGLSALALALGALACVTSPSLTAADQKKLADDEAAQVLCVERAATREVADACREAVKAQRDAGKGDAQ